MPSIKDKIKNTVEETAKKAEKAIKESDIENKLKDAASKAKEAAVQANEKLEESGVKENVKGKVSEALSDENKEKAKQAAKEGAEKAKQGATKALEVAKKNTKFVKYGAIAAVVAVLVFMGASLISPEKSFTYEEDGIKTEMTYFFKEGQIFGEVFDLKSKTYSTITPRKIVSDIWGMKITRISKANFYNHAKSNSRVEDVAFVISAKDPLFGQATDLVFKKAKIEFQEQTLYGYDVFVYMPKLSLKAREPEYKLIYTKYLEKK
jgi:hypothetical protein|tara:strand:- start:349 stop:1140 length:792 start_codon:yes stop_codon:yes gene_type:complete